MGVAIIVLVILILLNAFFAASEIALISLNETKIKLQAEKNDKKAQKIFHLISEPGRFLGTIQIGITLAGFLASAFAADFFAQPLSQALFSWGIPIPLGVLETISVVVITLILSYFTLVFGELVPKQLAMKKAEEISKFAVTPLTWLFKVCMPVVSLLTASTNFIVRLFGVNPDEDDNETTEEDIRMMVDLGGVQGTIQHRESMMIHNVFEFNDKHVSDIITHRTEMSALPVNATLSETMHFVNDKKYTRYPVYDGTIDNIVGILHTKDLIQFFDQTEQDDFQLNKIIRAPYFIMESLNIDVLFHKMQQDNVHIAIVLDEYGGTEGLITIEDIIEEIVGDITSENTPEEEDDEIKILSENQYSISGIASLEDLEEVLHISFPSDDFVTLSGFLIGQLGYIPMGDEIPVITYKEVQFEVTEIIDNRIARVLATVGLKQPPIGS